MKLIKWAYTKKYNIKAIFDSHPHSPVIFRQIKEYYFIYSVKWACSDPIVTRQGLEEMEWILNKELGTLEEYKKRKQFQKSL